MKKEARSGKPRVVGYCRVSTDYLGQIESNDHQIEHATERIKKNPEWEFAGIYADPAYTGTNDNRPEFQRMMADARKHKFEIILVKSISRLARNTILIIETLKELKELGISVIFEKENIDTGAPYSEMLLTIMSAFAQEESRNISERVKKGIHMRAQNGEVSWTPVYGYTKKGDEAYIIVPEEAEIVRLAFDEYEKGMLPHKIAAKINSMGMPSPGGQQWKHQNITQMLKNPKYCGDILTGTTYIRDHMSHKQVRNKGEVDRIYLPDHHEGIVPREQWERVNKIQKMRARNEYPFMDLLFCPKCGKALKKKLFGHAGYWCCFEDNFFLRNYQVEKALIRAAADSGRKVGKPEFWWIDEQVAEIVISDHYWNNDYITVKWKDGTETTVPSKAKHPWETPDSEINEEYIPPVRGPKTVRKIKAEK